MYYLCRLHVLLLLQLLSYCSVLCTLGHLMATFVASA